MIKQRTKLKHTAEEELMRYLHRELEELDLRLEAVQRQPRGRTL